MDVRPRRAAEAFCRCEQAFESRTRDMAVFSPFFFFSFSGKVRDGGAFGGGFVGLKLRGLNCGCLAGFGRRGRGRRRARGGDLGTAYILLVGAMNRGYFTQSWANSANLIGLVGHFLQRWPSARFSMLDLSKSRDWFCFGKGAFAF